MRTSENAITINDLTKRYKGSQVNALSNLNLTIKHGEVYGFLGPNGAGKSTAIRLIMNFLYPTSGKIYINDQLVGSSPKIYSKVGYLSGDFVAYPKLTGSEFLEYMQSLSGIASDKNISHLADILEIDLSKKIGSLSKGNRQKVGLIQAFMNDPEILILDEPTSGLDPLKQDVFYDLVVGAKNRGACVFVSSHNLSEVQKMCDRIGIIRDGKLVHQTSMSDLKIEATQTFIITFKKLPSISEVKNITGIKNVEKIGPKQLTVHVHGSLSPLLGYLSKHEITKLETHDVDLESEFMRYYEESEKP